MDKMATELGIDPVGFRIRNEPETHPESGQPFSSRAHRGVPAPRRPSRRLGPPRPHSEVPARQRLAVGTGVAVGSHVAPQLPGDRTRLQAAQDGLHRVDRRGRHRHRCLNFPHPGRRRRPRRRPRRRGDEDRRHGPAAGHERRPLLGHQQLGRVHRRGDPGDAAPRRRGARRHGPRRGTRHHGGGARQPLRGAVRHPPAATAPDTGLACPPFPPLPTTIRQPRSTPPCTQQPPPPRINIPIREDRTWGQGFAWPHTADYGYGAAAPPPAPGGSTDDQRQERKHIPARPPAR
jgi:hypothetical protein